MNSIQVYNLGTMPAIFNDQPVEDLGAGIQAGFGVVGYRGKVWSIKYQGNEQQLMRKDGDGAQGSIEVVILKSSNVISKIYYAGGYVEGSTDAPTCFSTNGQTPDNSVINKQSPVCATCPHNAWGSRITESGKSGKNCADSKRVAIVPTADIKNEIFGGPMLLRVPAASLRELQNYGDGLVRQNYRYYAVSTRISFDPTVAYPHFQFNPVRLLTSEEGELCLDLRNDQRVARILSENEFTGTPQGTPAPAAPSPTPLPNVPKTPFGNKPTPPVTSSVTPAKPPAAQPAPSQPAPIQPPTQVNGFGDVEPSPRPRRTTPPVKPVPVPTQAKAAPSPPPVQVPTQVGEADEAPNEFNAMLEDLLGE